jgi:hypothetical protein
LLHGNLYLHPNPSQQMVLGAIRPKSYRGVYNDGNC